MSPKPVRAVLFTVKYRYVAQYNIIVSCHESGHGGQNSYFLLNKNRQLNIEKNMLPTHNKYVKGHTLKM